MTALSEEALIAEWIRIGSANPWVGTSVDPPFGFRSFHRCADLTELRHYFIHGSWARGQAFYYHDLCFIQQVDGGDEWLTIRHGLAFESFTMRVVIRKGDFAGVIADLLAATLEECRDGNWRTRGH